MTGARVAATCVSYNCADLLKTTLAALLAQEVKGGMEVVVIDNASTDGSAAAAAAYPGVNVIPLDRNVGFGAAHNVGARATTAPYLLIINPDVETPAGVVEGLAAFLDDHPDAAAAGPSLVDRNGKLQRYCARRFPTLMQLTLQVSGVGETRWAGAGALHGFYPPPYYSRGPAPAAALTGACMMIRRAAFDAVGGFDERYFLYSEDLDLCRALRRKGYGVWFLPLGPVRHFTGGSRRTPRPFVVAAYRASAARYARKWHGTVAGVWIASASALTLRFWRLFWGGAGWFRAAARERGRFYREVILASRRRNGRPIVS